MLLKDIKLSKSNIKKFVVELEKYIKHKDYEYLNLLRDYGFTLVKEKNIKSLREVYISRRHNLVVKIQNNIKDNQNYKNFIKSSTIKHCVPSLIKATKNLMLFKYIEGDKVTREQIDEIFNRIGIPTKIYETLFNMDMTNRTNWIISNNNLYFVDFELVNKHNIAEKLFKKIYEKEETNDN